MNKAEYDREYYQSHKAEKKEYKRKNYQIHIIERHKHSKEYYQAHKAETASHHINYMLQTKTEALTHYGKDGKLACNVCGYKENIDGLELDHINGFGTEHRRRLKGTNIYLWLKNHNYPEGFQTLCGTCHRIKTINSLRLTRKR